MRGLQRWLLGLWVWWAISSLLVLGMTAAGFFFSITAFWSETDANLEPKIHSLTESFSALSEQQSSTVLDLREAVLDGHLTLATLQQSRLQTRPFLTLYYVTANGHPVLPGDTLQAPGWMLSVAAGLQPGTMSILTPVPPGMDLGFGGPSQPPPADYRVAALKGPDTWLFGAADLDYVFGPWLDAVRRNADLGHATVRRIDHQVLWQAAPPAGPQPSPTTFQGNIDINDRGTRWTRRITVFPTHTAWPFDAVELSVDVGPEMASMKHVWSLVALACVALLGGFAVSLRLAGSALSRDLAAAHIRANFTAMVSHELKTPVAAICLTTEILENKLIDDPQKIEEYHVMLHREALRLKRLIENVMRLLGLGGQAHLEPTGVESVVDQAIDEATEGAGVKRQVAANVPKALMDREAAVRAVANLVQNALKYGGDAADVMVAVSEPGRYIQVDVMDRGPGVPRRLRQAIFEPYFRIQDEDRRDKPGTGLGLALVKVLMERQNGKVSVHDRPGGGSIFRVVFRRA